jgi:hypothetical protein
MKKIFKLAEEFELKLYRKKLVDNEIKKNLEKAFQSNQGEDLEVTYNKQHFGWFIWDPVEKKHIQKDLNDFEADDSIKDVRDFVSNLKDVKLEDYI